MPDRLRPADYMEYRDTAVGILNRSGGTESLQAFGLDELFGSTEAATDLGPAYAFLEAQGYTGAVSPALALVGLAGELQPGGPPLLLGSRLGTTPLVGVPGWTAGSPVAVEREGAGLVVVADPGPAIRAPGPSVAEEYLTVLDVDRVAGTPLVAEEELNGRRAVILARTQLGAAAELLGVVDRLLEDVLGYARQRRQFGRTIGSYQSMQHLLAWAATERHQLVSLLDIAVARAASAPPDPQLSRAVKAMAGRVLHTVAQTAIQVTGGISFTWEYSLNRLHRRGMALDQLAGASADLIAAIGRQVRTEGVVPELLDLSDASA
jgi:hypothetical protein